MAKFLIVVSALIFTQFAFAAPKELRIAIGNAMINFDPLAMPNQNTLLISRQTNCQLTRLVEGEVRGDAASEFFFDHARKTLTFKLKPDLTFSDGSPLRAEDVEATLKYYVAMRPFVRNSFDWISKISSSNQRHEVTIAYRDNPNLLLQSLSMTIFPILRKVDVQSVKSANWQMPVGCGSYKFATRTSDEIELVSRTGTERKLKFKLFADNEIQNGEIGKFDFVTIPFTGNSPSGFKEIQINDPYQIYVGINTAKPEWGDRKARCQALGGFNVDDAVRGYSGRAIPADDYYPKGIFGYESASRFARIQKVDETIKLPKPKCIAMLRVSVPKSLTTAYAKHSQFADLEVKTIVDAAHFKSEFEKSQCDFLVIGLKSNSLDGYEFQLLFTEPKTNFTNLFDSSLADMIAAGQKATDHSAKYLLYRRISEQVASSCSIRPLVTVPYKTVLLRENFKIQGLGDLALNDVLLNW